MSSETIYRIQDNEGRGPFRPGFSRRWVEPRPDHENLMPWTMEFGRVDRALLFGEMAGSGCRTLEQLRRWFTQSEYETLVKYGYRAVKMGIGRVLAEPEKQCMFGRAEPLREDVEEVQLY